ncbi:MAG: putative Na+/H+ antiporter, partial [Bdellovibrionota bacterium]|nr:putative Na+/H+ antiporter [Bdellovibrionota bacterium]
MNVNPSTLEITATVIFALAVIHTFIASKFQQMAHHYPTGSIMENLFHFLGEVEAVFGMWAAVFLVSYAFIDPDGWRTYKMLEDGSYFLNADGAHVVAGGALKYLMSVNFTEPAFVFVIMAIAGSRPIIVMAEKMIIAFT